MLFNAPIILNVSVQTAGTGNILCAKGDRKRHAFAEVKLKAESDCKVF